MGRLWSVSIALSFVVAACQAEAPQPRPLLESSTSSAVARGDDPTSVAPDAVSTPAAGARDPKVIVTLWTDYECPQCRRMHDVAARLLDAWPDEVQVQFRQRPLDGDELARPAAMVALAAHRQEKFRCMNSALIVSRPQWKDLSPETFLAFASERLVAHCALAPDVFARDVRDPALAQKVEADLRLARDLAVIGTPAAMVDGLDAKLWPFAGVRPALLLNGLVRRALRERRADATAGERVYGNLGDPDLTARLLDSESN